MLTIDKSSTVWVAQDASPNVLRIDQSIEGEGAKTQIKIPFPTSQVKQVSYYVLPQVVVVVS